MNQLTRTLVVAACGLVTMVACGGGGGGESGKPATVARLTDLTAGMVVIGDRMRATGEDLDGVTQVIAGGAVAKILAQGPTALEFQIPSRAKGGDGEVVFVHGGGETAFDLSIHRLGLFLMDDFSSSNDAISVWDTSYGSVVDEIRFAQSTVHGPRQIAMVNGGSLAVIPSGAGTLLWIDMTTMNTGVLSVLGASELLGAAVDPFDSVIAVTDRDGSRIFPIEILESVPPYAAPLRARPATSVAGELLRSPRWIGENELVVISENNDLILEFELASTMEFQQRDSAPTGDFPSEIALVGDAQRALVTSVRSDGTRLFRREQLAEQDSHLVPGEGTISVAMDRANGRAFAAVEGDDRIQILGVEGDSLVPLGEADFFGFMTKGYVVAVDPESDEFARLFVGGPGTVVELIERRPQEFSSKTARLRDSILNRNVVGIALQE